MRHRAGHSVPAAICRWMKRRCARLVRRQIEAGINFLVPCGTTGESPTLTRAEHLRVVEITLEEAKGKVPVLAGAGGYNTARSDRTGARARSAWARTASSPSRRTTTSPRRKACTSTTRRSPRPSRLPIVVYSVQGRTGVNVEPATLARLAADREHRRREGSVGQHRPDGERAPRSARRLHRALGRRRHHLPLIALGGRGVISVASNEIPGEMTQLAQACLRGDFAGRARDPARSSCR